MGFQTPHWEKATKHWQRRFEAYKKQLAKILPKMNSSGRAFFRDALVLHDETLRKLEVGDRIADPTRTGRQGRIARRLEVRLSVISTAFLKGAIFCDTKVISRIALSLPGQVTLFSSRGEYPNFGDWGSTSYRYVGREFFVMRFCSLRGQQFRQSSSDFRFGGR